MHFEISQHNALQSPNDHATPRQSSTSFTHSEIAQASAPMRPDTVQFQPQTASEPASAEIITEKLKNARATIIARFNALPHATDPDRMRSAAGALDDAMHVLDERTNAEHLPALLVDATLGSVYRRVNELSPPYRLSILGRLANVISSLPWSESRRALAGQVTGAMKILDHTQPDAERFSGPPLGLPVPSRRKLPPSTSYSDFSVGDRFRKSPSAVAFDPSALTPVTEVLGLPTVMSADVGEIDFEHIFDDVPSGCAPYDLELPATREDHRVAEKELFYANAADSPTHRRSAVDVTLRALSRNIAAETGGIETRNANFDRAYQLIAELPIQERLENYARLEKIHGARVEHLSKEMQTAHVLQQAIHRQVAEYNAVARFVPPLVTTSPSKTASVGVMTGDDSHSFVSGWSNHAQRSRTLRRRSFSPSSGNELPETDLQRRRIRHRYNREQRLQTTVISDELRALVLETGRLHNCIGFEKIYTILHARRPEIKRDHVFLACKALKNAGEFLAPLTDDELRGKLLIILEQNGALPIKKCARSLRDQGYTISTERVSLAVNELSRKRSKR